MPDRLIRYVRRAAPLIIVLSLAFPLSGCTWTTGDTDHVGYSFARDVFPIDDIVGVAILAIITLPILSVVIGMIRRRSFGPVYYGVEVILCFAALSWLWYITGHSSQRLAGYYLMSMGLVLFGATSIAEGRRAQKAGDKSGG